MCSRILRIGPRFPLIDSNRAQYRFPLQLASISCRSSSLWIRSRMVRGFPNMESPLMGNSPATDSSSSSSSTCAPGRMYIMASLHIALAFSAPDCSLPLKTGVAFQEMCPVYRYFYRFSAYVFQKGRFRPRNAYVFSAFWVLREQWKQRLRVGFDALIADREFRLRNEQYRCCVPVVRKRAIVVFTAKRSVIV